MPFIGEASVTEFFLTAGVHGVDLDAAEIDLMAAGHSLQYNTIRVAPAKRGDDFRTLRFKLHLSGESGAALWDNYRDVYSFIQLAEAAAGAVGQGKPVTAALRLNSAGGFSTFYVQSGTIDLPDILNDDLIADVSLDVLAWGLGPSHTYPLSGTLKNDATGFYWIADFPTDGRGLTSIELIDTSTAGAINRIRMGVMSRADMAPDDFEHYQAGPDTQVILTPSYQELATFSKPAGVLTEGEFDIYLDLRDITTAAAGDAGDGSGADGSGGAITLTVTNGTNRAIVVEQTEVAVDLFTSHVALELPHAPDEGNLLILAAFMFSHNDTQSPGSFLAPPGFDDLVSTVHQVTRTIGHSDDHSPITAQFFATLATFSRRVTGTEGTTYSVTTGDDSELSTLALVEISGLQGDLFSGNLTSGVTLEPQIHAQQALTTSPAMALALFGAQILATTDPASGTDVHLAIAPTLTFPDPWVKLTEFQCLTLAYRIFDTPATPGVQPTSVPASNDDGLPFFLAQLINLNTFTPDSNQALSGGDYHYVLAGLDDRGGVVAVSPQADIHLGQDNQANTLDWPTPFQGRSDVRMWRIYWFRDNSLDAGADTGWVYFNVNGQTYTHLHTGNEITTDVSQPGGETPDLLTVTALPVPSQIQGRAGTVNMATANLFPGSTRNPRKSGVYSGHYAGYAALPPMSPRTDGSVEDWRYVVYARHANQAAKTRVRGLYLLPHGEPRLTVEYPGLNLVAPRRWVIECRPDERTSVVLYDKNTGDEAGLGIAIGDMLPGSGDNKIVIFCEREGGIIDLVHTRWTVQVTATPRFMLQYGTLNF